MMESTVVFLPSAEGVEDPLTEVLQAGARLAAYADSPASSLLHLRRARSEKPSGSMSVPGARRREGPTHPPDEEVDLEHPRNQLIRKAPST